MDTNAIGKRKLIKVGAAALLSVGLLGACGDNDNDDIDIHDPNEPVVTPDANPDADVDIDMDEPDDTGGDYE